MSILVIKKFDVIMREMSEMMGDIQTLKPSKISFNVMGDVCEFEDATIELHNGFLKVIGDDGVDVLRYRDVCGYSLKSLHTPSKSPLMEDVDEIEMMMDEIWRELSNKSSSLSPSLLKREIPFDEFKRIIDEFICEYEGLRDFNEIFEDEWMIDKYTSYIMWYQSNKISYEDLNDDMRCLLWDLYYSSHILRDDYTANMERGIEWSKNDYLWINDVISHYVDFNEDGDEDE